MLKHAKKYVFIFDYEAELAVFRKKEKYFNYSGPNGYRGEFGRMEAFIFRRVNNNEMTLQQISGWIDILQKDLDGLD